MLTPAIPSDEAQRLNALKHLELLDTPPTERFDRITRLACDLFDVPIALVTLVDKDRQWFKSSQGYSTRQTQRNLSFCGHTILSDEVFVVENMRRDLRFADNPMVTGEPRVRFYAGCPIATPDGYRVGTVCVLDKRSRRFGEKDARQLRDLAALVEASLELEGKTWDDEFTGLGNRRTLEREGRGVLRRCSAQALPVSVLYFNLDRLKQINEQHGHAAGDRTIQQFAGALRRAFRERDVKARVDGDEFALVLANAEPDDTYRTLERLDRQLVTIATESRTPLIEYSVGLASRSETGKETLEEMLEDAVRGMRADKMSGRSSDCVS